MKTLDARGLSCPQPVIMVMNAVKEGNKEFTIIVDNQVAVENITRFVQNKKLTNTVEKNHDDFYISIH